jgi:Rrf2 family nitric oxide-sensitive transcriptional repressor
MWDTSFNVKEGFLMRLTAYTDYSLRVLIYLGLRGERLATISELSETYGLSANHLMKIIHNLGKLGYIETVRGRCGGMKLAGAPEEINLGQVVRQMEPDFAIAECFDPERRADCVIIPACRLQLVLRKAVDAFLDVLDNHTLADVLQNRTRLRSLLNIEMPESRPS